MVGHSEKLQTIINILIVSFVTFYLVPGSLGLRKIIITLLGIKVLTCICDGVL